MKFVIYVPVICLGLISSSYVWAVTEDNRPEYQKEYDAYLEDLNIIAQTGKAPYNAILESDLAKMSSNDKIMLTAPKPNNDLRLAQNNNAKIMNSIEIINVPEEFRKDYGYVQEENKTISTQSIVDADNLAKKELAKNSKDISDHINPFRLLKELPLSVSSERDVVPSEMKNPMVGAYFNPFGRPFVAGKPKSVLQEQIPETRSRHFELSGPEQYIVSQNEVKNTEKEKKTSTVEKQPVEQEVIRYKTNVAKTSVSHHTASKVTKNSSPKATKRRGSIGLRGSMFVD